MFFLFINSSNIELGGSCVSSAVLKTNIFVHTSPMKNSRFSMFIGLAILENRDQILPVGIDMNGCQLQRMRQ